MRAQKFIDYLPDPAGIPADAKVIRDNRRHGKLFCNVLYNFYLILGLIIHGNVIIKDNPFAREHECYVLVPVILLPFEVGLVEFASSMGCRARDEGFVLEEMISSTMQKTGLPDRSASP